MIRFCVLVSINYMSRLSVEPFFDDLLISSVQCRARVSRCLRSTRRCSLRCTCRSARSTHSRRTSPHFETHTALCVERYSCTSSSTRVSRPSGAIKKLTLTLSYDLLGTHFRVASPSHFLSSFPFPNATALLLWRHRHRHGHRHCHRPEALFAPPPFIHSPLPRVACALAASSAPSAAGPRTRYWRITSVHYGIVALLWGAFTNVSGRTWRRRTRVLEHCTKYLVRVQHTSSYRFHVHCICTPRCLICLDYRIL